MAAGINNSSKQFVVFKLDKEEYGVDIQTVTTIERIINVARVPKAPPYITGVINLRGEIIPVMDLRKRFNMSEMEITDDTRVIILKLDDNPLGITVDSVSEVIELKESEIENVTNFSNDLTLDYILGVGKSASRLVTLLNLEKLITELMQ